MAEQGNHVMVCNPGVRRQQRLERSESGQPTEILGWRPLVVECLVREVLQVHCLTISTYGLQSDYRVGGHRIG